jgi:ABC-2 type transport system ATP-binding protein
MTDPAPLAADVRGLSRRFGDVVALADVSLTLTTGAVHGLLGRNGAGKTTLMQILAGHLPASGGRVEVLGRDPWEDAETMRRVSLIREAQAYPNNFRVRHVLRAASWFHPNWDAGYAERLAAEFELPPNRTMTKLSRGMLSAVGIVVGLASRAPLTLFDEPYLGLDAPSRHRFYDHLLADLAEHPRTVLVSTHLIDEIADLLEHVVLLERGRVLLQAETDDLRSRAATVIGPGPEVEAAVAGAGVLSRERLAGTTRATVRHRDRLTLPADSSVRLEPVSLQQLVVHLTAAGSASGPTPEPGSDPDGAGSAHRVEGVTR